MINVSFNPGAFNFVSHISHLLHRRTIVLNYMFVKSPCDSLCNNNWLSLTTTELRKPP